MPVSLRKLYYCLVKLHYETAVTQTSEVTWVTSRDRAFSVLGPYFQNVLPCDVCLPPILLFF